LDQVLYDPDSQGYTVELADTDTLKRKHYNAASGSRCTRWFYDFDEVTESGDGFVFNVEPHIVPLRKF
jgi:hypothetical protein